MPDLPGLVPRDVWRMSSIKQDSTDAWPRCLVHLIVDGPASVDPLYALGLATRHAASCNLTRCRSGGMAAGTRAGL